MSAGLTLEQKRTLSALEGCTGPWAAAHPKNRRALDQLGRKGLAVYRAGLCCGWVITEAGRLALAEAETK